MVVDGWEPWPEVKPDAAARSSSSSRGGPVERGGWPNSRAHSSSPARRHHWPPPPPPPTFAAYGRAGRGSGVRGRWTRARRGFRVHGAERDQAAAGGNAAADSIARGVAREGRGSGGGVGWKGKRGLSPDASLPPTSKRRDVSSTRWFPAPVYGRESAARSVRRGGGDGGVRVGASPSHGGFGCKEGGFLPARMEKVVAANGGAPAADWRPHTTHASVGDAGLMEINGARRGFFGFFGGARSGHQLGKKQLESLSAAGGLDALAHDTGYLASYGNSATETVRAMVDENALDGAVECQELEEGEIADKIDTVEAMNEYLLDEPVEGQELEGEIAASATMVIVGVLNKDTFYGSSVECQELEEGDIAPYMDTAEAMNEDTLDGAAEVHESDEGEIADTIGIVESANKKPSDGTVEVQKLEEAVIAATIDTVESTNNQPFDGVVVVQELEQSEIAAMDIGDIRNKDSFVPPAEDRELEAGIAAKEHGGEPDADEIATESDHIVQQTVNVIPLGFRSGIMRSKIRLTARKAVRPPVKAIHMLTTAAAVNKFQAAEAKPVPVSAASSSASSTATATSMKFKAANTKPVPVPTSLASKSALPSRENREYKHMFVTEVKLKGKRVTYLDDDDILKALAVHEGKLELCLSDRSVWRHRQHGGRNADPRSKVRMMCRRFEFLCRFLAQAVKQGLIRLRRIDLAADQVIKDLRDYTKHGSMVGKVAGVQVGDEFLFRVELAIVGLHSPYRAGIDTTKDTDGELIAVSIVASGGYLDEFSSSGELVYTGSGGKAAGNDHDGDQKLQRGNLALRNCITRKIPVRVIHGFKSQNREEGTHSIGKEISKFIYDGLYHVVAFWPEGIPGSRVFKYRLRRIPEQPQLPLDIAKWLRKSVVHPC